jgi:hypothetical protein
MPVIAPATALPVREFKDGFAKIAIGTAKRMK